MFPSFSSKCPSPAHIRIHIYMYYFNQYMYTTYVCDRIYENPTFKIILSMHILSVHFITLNNGNNYINGCITKCCSSLTVQFLDIHTLQTCNSDITEATLICKISILMEFEKCWIFPYPVTHTCTYVCMKIKE